jgi:hypothetical protein
MDAKTALGMWGGFPVSAVPRPLVLADATGHVAGGFDSGEAKIAFLDSGCRSRASVP